MFHNDTGGLLKVFNALKGGVGIGDIVVGQGFTLQLNRRGNTHFLRGVLTIKGGLLMGVFAVAHRFGFNQLQVQRAREALATVTQLLAKVVGDGAVVMRRMFKGFNGEIKSCFLPDGIVVGVQLFYQAAVISGIDHDGDVTMIFGGGADHGRSADIDIFNGIFKAAVGASNRGFKGVQVNHDHIDRGNSVAGHNLIVSTPAA